jgi:hypothetical protein
MLKEREAHWLESFPSLFLLNPTLESRINSCRMPALKAEAECIFKDICLNRVVPRVYLRPFHDGGFFILNNKKIWCFEIIYSIGSDACLMHN